MEAAALTLPELPHGGEGLLAARTPGPFVHLPVPLQHVATLPFEEIEAVVPRLRHQLQQFGVRQGADAAEGMHEDAEQHFVLDDVADAGKDRLVQQRVAGEFRGPGAELRLRRMRIPAGRQDVRRPIVGGIEIAFDP
jgi:hypothetical protein